MASIDVRGSEAKMAAMKLERFAISETLAMITDETKILIKNCMLTVTSGKWAGFTMPIAGDKIPASHG